MSKPHAQSHSHNELAQIQSETLAHYQTNAESFWQGTREHDVSQNIQALLTALPKDQSLDILDFGCGPGRDLKTFKDLGHKPIGLDGCENFCKMAQDYSGCQTLNQQFLELDLNNYQFDGIFANASLFHIPSQQLTRVLKKLHTSLKPNGILFSSNPRGDQEGWSGQRYGHYMEFEITEKHLNDAGFNIIEHYYRPTGQPRELQPWLAIVSQKMSLGHE